GSVPDFLWVDRDKVLGPLTQRRCGRRGVAPGLIWALYHAVVVQCRSVVYLPDIYLRRIVWGALGWPPNWRQRIACLWGSQTLEQEELHGCYAACPFFGTGVGHQHFGRNIPTTFLGALERFVVTEDGTYRKYDFHPDPKQLEKN